ncbi:hypothetical protein [Nesterenkonia populi]
MTSELTQAWEDELLRTGQTTIRPSWKKAALYLPPLAAFAVLGFFILMAGLNDGDWWYILIGILCLGFFGVIGLPSIFIQLVSPKYHLVVDWHAISTGGATVPWSEVVGAGDLQQQIRTAGGRTTQAHLAVWLTPEGREIQRSQLGPIARALEPMSLRMVQVEGGGLMMPGKVLPGRRQDLVAWLSSVHERTVPEA